MYAERYHGSAGFRPVSLTTSVAITGAMIAGLIFANPHVVMKPREKDLVTSNIPIPPPPKPQPPKPHAKTPVQQEMIQPPTQVTIARPDETHLVLTVPELPPTPPVTGLREPVADPTPVAPPAPVLTDVQPDPRYADALQPNYPAEERRAEREGRVIVRVLVGVDGRVKQVLRMSATSDAFFAATERQALRSWRFKPATRDGIPVEGWRTMALRFELRTD